MKLSRKVGTVSEILNLFVQDASVSTGAGLANIPATTVSYSWLHNTQAAVSTGVGLSTASVGSFTSGAWVQVSSSLALGWYQFGIPNGALAAGDAVLLHLYVSTGAFPMAPLPIEIELTQTDNQTAMSSQNISSVVGSVGSVLGTTSVNVIQILGSTPSTSAAGIYNVNVKNIQNSNAVTTSAGVLSVSTQALSSASFSSVTGSVGSILGTTAVNVLQILGSGAVTSAAGIFDVNIKNIVNSAAVTTGAGILNTSTQSLSSANFSSVTGSVGSILGTTAVNVLQIQGSGAVTSAAGIFDVNVIKFLNTTSVGTPGYVGIDWGQITNTTATQYLSGTTISSVANNVFSGTSNVNVIQVQGSAAVTSAAGIFDTNVIKFLNTTSVGRPGYVGIDWGQITNSTTTQNLSGTTISSVTNFSISGTSNVNVIQIQGQNAVTTSAGVLQVSTQAIDKTGYTVSTNQDKTGYTVATNQDKTGYSLTAAEEAAIAGVVWTSTFPEAYRGLNAVGNMSQLMYEILANNVEFGNSVTTRTLNSVTSHTAISVQYQYDSTTPSAITRLA